jgi:hypothetical protein
MVDAGFCYFSEQASRRDLCRRRYVNLYNLVPQSAESVSELFDSQLDSGFDGAKWSMCEGGNFTLALLLEKCQTDNLSLIQRQRTKVLSQKRTKIFTKRFSLDRVRFVDSLVRMVAGNLVAIRSSLIGTVLPQAVNRAPSCKRAEPA